MTAWFLRMTFVSSSVFRSLGVHHNNRGLILPHLHSIHWDYGNETCLFLESLLGPHLTVLSSVITHDIAISLPSASPLLHTLRVVGVEDPAALSKAVCGLKALQELSCKHSLTSEAILHVATLSSLHTLTVTNEAREIMEILSTGPPRRYFTSIHTLSLMSDLAGIAPLLDFVRPKTLLCLTINKPPDSQFSASEHKALSRRMTTACPSLKSVYWSMKVKGKHTKRHHVTLHPR
jgi:hypothetical protein